MPDAECWISGKNVCSAHCFAYSAVFSVAIIECWMLSSATLLNFSVRLFLIPRSSTNVIYSAFSTSFRCIFSTHCYPTVDQNNAFNLKIGRSEPILSVTYRHKPFVSVFTSANNCSRPTTPHKCKTVTCLIPSTQIICTHCVHATIIFIWWCCVCVCGNDVGFCFCANDKQSSLPQCHIIYTTLSKSQTKQKLPASKN